MVIYYNKKEVMIVNTIQWTEEERSKFKTYCNLSDEEKQNIIRLQADYYTYPEKKHPKCTQLDKFKEILCILIKFSSTWNQYREEEIIPIEIINLILKLYFDIEEIYPFTSRIIFKATTFCLEERENDKTYMFCNMMNWKWGKSNYLWIFNDKFLNEKFYISLHV
jgi:hypothetical protein